MNYWLYLLSFIGAIFMLALLALEAIGRRDQRRAEQRRQLALDALVHRPEDHPSPWDLDAMSRGKDPSR